MHPATSRAGRRIAVLFFAVLLLLVGVGSAAAHVEATADGAQAGNGPVTVSFSAAAESPTAGISSVRTRLPAGVLPEWLSLAAGPPGWTLTTTADAYEVSGPPLPQGTDAEFSIEVGQLPADLSGEVTLPTVVTYADGSEDAWIEVPTADNPEPAMPAPSIPMAAAPAQPSASASGSAPEPSPSATTTSPAGRALPEEPAPDDDAGAGLVVGLGVGAAAVLAGGLWFWRRRGSAPS